MAKFLSTIYKVRIYTGKNDSLDNRVRLSPRNIKTIRQLICEAFPANHFEVTIIEDNGLTIIPATPGTELWRYAEKPIVLGYGRMADVIQKTKNYLFKVLISPTVRPEKDSIDEYDREHTTCVFGSDEHSSHMGRVFRRTYYKDVRYCNRDEASLLIDGLFWCPLPKDYKKKKVVSNNFEEETNAKDGYCIFRFENFREYRQ